MNIIIDENKFLVSYGIKYNMVVKQPDNVLSKMYDEKNELIVNLRIPTNEYRDEDLQELIKWSTLSNFDDGYFRNLAIYMKLDEKLERTIVFTHAYIRLNRKINIKADYVDVELIVNQRGDKFVGVVFVEKLEETLKEAKDKVQNPPKLNIIVPVGNVIDMEGDSPTYTYPTFIESSEAAVNHQAELISVDKLYNKKFAHNGIEESYYFNLTHKYDLCYNIYTTGDFNTGGQLLKSVKNIFGNYKNPNLICEVTKDKSGVNKNFYMQQWLNEGRYSLNIHNEGAVNKISTFDLKVELNQDNENANGKSYKWKTSKPSPNMVKEIYYLDEDTCSRFQMYINADKLAGVVSLSQEYTLSVIASIMASKVVSVYEASKMATEVLAGSGGFTISKIFTKVFGNDLVMFNEQVDAKRKIIKQE